MTRELCMSFTTQVIPTKGTCCMSVQRMVDTPFLPHSPSIIEALFNPTVRMLNNKVYTLGSHQLRRHHWAKIRERVTL